MRIAGPRERGLTAREHWPRYIAGMLAETAFILALTGAAFLLAALAMAVY